MTFPEEESYGGMHMFGLKKSPGLGHIDEEVKALFDHAAKQHASTLAILCRGRRIRICGHSDFGSFNNVEESSISTWVQVDTASAACLHILIALL